MLACACVRALAQGAETGKGREGDGDVEGGSEGPRESESEPQVIWAMAFGLAWAGLKGWPWNWFSEWPFDWYQYPDLAAYLPGGANN